jgi:hypothetical protein
MPFSLHLSLFDIAGVFGAGLPTLTGSIFAPPPPSGSPTAPLDSATSAAPSQLTLNFASPAVPPAGVSALLVQDPASSGDIFRSGPLGALPASPANLTVITTPSVSISAADLASSVAGFAPTSFMIPTEAAVLVGILTAGMFIPLSGSILTAALSITAPGLTLTVTGTFVAQQFYFATITHTFRLSFTMTPAPSGDPTDRQRILSLTPSGASLASTGVAGFVTAALAPVIAGIATSQAEGAINDKIKSTAILEFSNNGYRLSPSSVLSAHRASVLASGFVLQIVLADLFGPAVLPIPRSFVIQVAPTPTASKMINYLITVTDAATGAPVDAATLTLHNFTPTGNAQNSSGTTNAAGQVSFHVSLHMKKVVVSGGSGGPLHETVFVSPTLTVSKSGYDRLTISLLDEDTLN